MTQQIPAARGESRKLLAIRYHLIFDDLVRLFEAQGFVVEIWEASEVSLERFKECCADTPPWAVFAINYSPEIALLTSLFSIPYVSWTIDPLPSHRLRVRDGTKSFL